MPTKRTRVNRTPASKITPEAVEAFRAGDHNALHTALGLKPWEINPLEAVGACPYSDNTGGAKSWPQAQELRRELQRMINVKSNQFQKLDTDKIEKT